MSWLRFVVADLRRSPIRTFCTALSLVTAFVLFGLLQPIRVMFDEGIETSGESRLIVMPRHSVADMLPVNHATRVTDINQVDVVAHMTWFGGVYQDAQNFFPQFAVTPDEFLSVFPEVQIKEDVASAFTAGRRAAIVGQATADRFGWQEGDVVSLIPTIWHNRDELAWDFEIVGLFTSTNEALIGNDGFYFGYAYFDEYRAFAHGSVGTLVVKTQDSADLGDVARRIDAVFANSSNETRTQNSTEYVLSFARQIGDVGLIASIILVAVLFTLLLLTGHAMSRSVHERTPELAVMRVLGFRSSSLSVFMLSEFVALSVSAAAIGLGLAFLITSQLEQAIPQMPQFGGMKIVTLIEGLALALFIGLAVSVLPVLRSVYRPIATALRVEA